jgi:hypothetical protein
VLEKVEQVGVETDRSREGIASRASEGETLRDGEEGGCSGEFRVLAGALARSSAMMWSCKDVMSWACNRKSKVPALWQPGGGVV